MTSANRAEIISNMSMANALQVMVMKRDTNFQKIHYNKEIKFRKGQREWGSLICGLFLHLVLRYLPD